jgi:DnaK suppressor protein
MNKELLKELKEKLEKEKIQVEKNLETFAEKDDKLEGDWDAKFPKWNDDSHASNSALEIAADEVEEYSTLLSLEHVLEIRLKNINSALKKIGSNKYGICEKCGKEIPIERLKIYPEARFCVKCK